MESNYNGITHLSIKVKEIKYFLSNKFEALLHSHSMGINPKRIYLYLDEVSYENLCRYIIEKFGSIHFNHTLQSETTIIKYNTGLGIEVNIAMFGTDYQHREAMILGMPVHFDLTQIKPNYETI